MAGIMLLIMVGICAVVGFVVVYKPNPEMLQSSFNSIKDSISDVARKATPPSSRTLVEPDVETTEWIFKPSDGRPVEILSEPHFDAELVGQQLQPGERIKVTEVVEHEGDVLFLKLADGRGWCVDRETGIEMCYELAPRPEGMDELWKYQPANSKPILLRDGPYIDGPKSGDRLQPGQKFKVCEIQAGEHDVLFLKLAGGKGWVFDVKPDERGDTPDGVLCKRVLDELWVYDQPIGGKPFTILKGPNVNGPKTSSPCYMLYPQELFRVDEIEAGEEGHDEGIIHLKLADGRGWMIDGHGEGDAFTQLCRRATSDARGNGGSTVTVTKAPEGAKVRVQSVEDFKVGSSVEIKSGKGTEKGIVKDIDAKNHELVLKSKPKYKHPVGALVTLQ